jgi:hypothetical protein
VKLAHLTSADYVVQPWKNGGGTTTQLAVDGPGDRWRWRVSVADVGQSGPFSDFAGYDRIIMLIGGDGMLLSFASAPAQRIDAHFRPFAFDGGWKTDCRLLGGPVRDLNLMVDRGYGRARMEPISVNLSTAAPTLRGVCDLLYCAEGGAEADVAGERTRLATGDALRIDGGAGQALALSTRTEAATIIHMSVQPL